MPRLTLIHWNAAEAEERAGFLRRAGYQVHCHQEQPEAGVRVLRENQPDAFVIDLSRVPSHGRAIGVWLRQRKATRHIPIVFVGGDPEKVAQVCQLLPDAGFAEWPGLEGALREALKNPPPSPLVPGTMQSYAGAPLEQKLGIRAGSRVALLGAPADFERLLPALPEGASLSRQARGPVDLALLFVRSSAELRRRFPAAARVVAEGGGLWLVWPKRTSGVAGDLSQTAVRAFGLAAGWVDFKICALDATWSGLRFARRARK